MGKLVGNLLGFTSAGNQAAAEQLQAGKMAASAAAFRPVDITNRFGSGAFKTGVDQYGTPTLEGASYTVSPEMKAIQDRLAGQFGASVGQSEQIFGQTAPALAGAAQGLFGLGAQYLAQSPEAAARDYYATQQALLEPTRQAEEARLQQSVFGRGRAGLNVGGANPDLATYAAANRMQDLQLASQAEQAAQQRIGFGAGLFGQGTDMYNQLFGLQTSALGPLQSQLGMVQTIEELAQQPLLLGAQLGGQQATAGANMGQSLLQAGLGAAQSRLQGNLAGGQVLGNIISSVGSSYFGKK